MQTWNTNYKTYKCLIALMVILLMGLGTLCASNERDDYENAYLTVESLADNNTIELKIPAEITTEEMISVSYSTDGDNWTTITIDGTTQTITLVLNQGEKAYYKGLGKQCGIHFEDATKHLHFTSTDRYILYGNIMSLFYGDDFASHTEFPEGSEYTLGGLWDYNHHLVSAENLILPATTMTYYCCWCTFFHCDSLTAVPDLPATTLAESCCEWMFESCTSLTEAPALLATNLADWCYYCMFSRCSALRAAPAMPATELAKGCYCYMYQLCISLTEPAELPAMQMADSCYMGLYWSCTALEKAPVLPAQVLAPSCYEWMFENCTSLSEVTCLATDISAENCVFEWLIAVSPTGVFYKAPEMEDWPLNSVSGVPEGWTVGNYDGLNDQQTQVEVYPNPVVDILHIKGKDIETVRVFDLQGRMVRSEECGRADQVEVNFQGCAEGVYTVSVQSEGGRVIRKVIY